MSLEGQSIDRKSLRVILGKTAGWQEKGACFGRQGSI